MGEISDIIADMPLMQYFAPVKRGRSLKTSPAGRRAALFFAAILCASFSVSLPAATPIPSAAAYSVTDLGPLANVADDVALDIGDDGGVSLYISDGTQVRAARWRGGKRLELSQAPGYLNSVAHATNGRGDVVGWSNNSANPVDSLSTTRAFVYVHKKMKMLGTLGGQNSRALGVNGSGEVVGVADVNRRASHAFILSGGELNDLGVLPGGGFSCAYAINSAGEVVGVADTARFVKHAVAWRAGKIRDLGTLPGGSSSCALAINARGDIAGYAETPDGVHAFLRSQGRMRDLGTLKFDPSVANDINGRGEVVGTSNVSAHASHAFLWRGGRMTDLNALIPVGSVWTLAGGSSINNRGEIVCVGNRRGEPAHALLLTPASVAAP